VQAVGRAGWVGNTEAWMAHGRVGQVGRHVPDGTGAPRPGGRAAPLLGHRRVGGRFMRGGGRLTRWMRERSVRDQRGREHSHI
jgi:hypothetical protein